MPNSDYEINFTYTPNVLNTGYYQTTYTSTTIEVCPDCEENSPLQEGGVVGDCHIGTPEDESFFDDLTADTPTWQLEEPYIVDIRYLDDGLYARLSDGTKRKISIRMYVDYGRIEFEDKINKKAGETFKTFKEIFEQEL